MFFLPLQNWKDQGLWKESDRKVHNGTSEFTAQETFESQSTKSRANYRICGSLRNILHPWKPTWHWKIPMFNGKIHLQMVFVFGGDVSFWHLEGQPKFWDTKVMAIFNAQHMQHATTPTHVLGQGGNVTFACHVILSQRTMHAIVTTQVPFFLVNM